MAETMSEREAELERERDEARAERDNAVRIGTEYRTWWLREAKRGDAAESREKQARVEGARECQKAFVAGAYWRNAYGLVPLRPNAQQAAEEHYPAPSAHAGEARPQPSVFRTDSAFADSLRVGGLCADCQALNRDASVTWKFCPKHTLSLRADQNAATTSAASLRVGGSCAVCKGTREVFDPVKSVWTWCRECQSHPPQAAPEPPRVVRLSGGRVMRWEHNEFGVAWLRRNGSELPPLHYFRNSCGELMYDYRVIAETPEDFTTLERLVQEVCAYLASRPTASGEG